MSRYLDSEEGRQRYAALNDEFSPGTEMTAQEFEAFVARNVPESTGIRQFVLDGIKNRDLIGVNEMLTFGLAPIFDADYILGLSGEMLEVEKKNVQERLLWTALLLYIFEHWVIKWEHAP